MQAVGGELRRAEGCMRTPLTPTLPNRTLTLELFDQGDDFLISLHLEKLDEQTHVDKGVQRKYRNLLDLQLDL